MLKETLLPAIPIEDMLATSLAGYKNQVTVPSDELKKYSFWRKLWNERQIKKLVDRLFDDLEPYMSELRERIETAESNSDSPALQEVKVILIRALKEIDDRRLLFDKPFLNQFIKEGYLNVAEGFLIRSKKEDAQLTNEEIFQALRNVWIMNSLQLYWDLPVELTTPMYAYSMLYPYTDNLLDDPEIDARMKKEFNDRLSKVLSGEAVLSKHHTEKRIFSLVEQIKATYPQDTYPEVTESIQLIHSAQIESLLQGNQTPLTEEEILTISFYKGGTSVLADAYLIKGSSTEEERCFAFQFGAFLQLLDDLQDKKEDQISHNQTLFSSVQTQEATDSEVRRLIAYIYSVNTIGVSDTDNAKLMKEVISQCTLIMIMEAVGKSPDMVTRSLYKELESYSKVRLSFYNELQKKMKIFMDTEELKGKE